MKRTIKNQRGIAAVEFALILIPLVLLVFGTIEFSTLLYDKAVITNASREGARAGIVYGGGGTGDVAGVVSAYCADHLISLGGSSGVTTTVTEQGTPPNLTLTVRVRYRYNFLVLPNIVSSLTDGVTLEAVTVMRKEDQRELEEES